MSFSARSNHTANMTNDQYLMTTKLSLTLYLWKTVSMQNKVMHRVNKIRNSYIR